jgi:putative transposase
MIELILVLCRIPNLLFPGRRNLIIENLALRHQLHTLQRTGKRAVLRPVDRLFWIWLSRYWVDWRKVLQIVQPSTVIAWHRKGFRLYWTWLSQRKRNGRPGTSREVIALIRRMAEANAWGAPRIHGELLKLGIDISERTVSRWLPRRPKTPSQTWKTFLANHLGETVSIDFFTVQTITFRVLFVFVVLAHDRRRVVHFNVTEHPCASWTAQQIIEAFPWESRPRYLLRDRDKIYGDSFRRKVRGMGIDEVLTAPSGSPW